MEDKIYFTCPNYVLTENPVFILIIVQGRHEKGTEYMGLV